MRKNHTFWVMLIGILIFSLISLFDINDCLSQTKEDKEGALRGIQRLAPSPHALRFSSSVGIFSGYDSNVELLPVSKGDVFEEFLYSLSFIKPFKNGLRLTLNYDLDVINYNEVRDASNLLNHLRLGIHQKIVPWLAVGTGYDLGAFYYPENEDGDFLFHRCFFYLRNSFSKNAYHQLLYEAGLKDYEHRKALGDTILTYQAKERKDRRQSLEYSIATSLASKWLLRLKGKFTLNDSNARYQDFYDYKSYEISSSVDYRLSDKAELLSNFSFTRRDYNERLVSLASLKQKDDIYAAELGIRYNLNKKNSLSLLYTYRNNSSNESLEKYTENEITCGWQYKF